MNNLKIYIFLALLTPLLWWTLFQLPSIFNEWKKTPHYFITQTKSFLTPEKLKFQEDLRWESEKHSNPLGRFFYNKSTSLMDEFFSAVSFLSPRIYFQAGDGNKLSPNVVEPTLIILFPLWIFGLISLVEARRFKPILLWLGFGVFAFLLGQKNFYFTLPIVFLNIFFITYFINKLKAKTKYLILSVVLIYGSYILGRAIWMIH